MSAPTTVMTSTSTADSASSASVKSTRSPPTSTIVNTRSTSTRPSAGSRAGNAANCATAPIPRPMAATTTPTATTLTAWRPKRRCSRAPNAALTIAPHNGTNGIRKSQPASTSLLERRHVVRVDGSEVAEDGEHDGERDRRLRRREHDDEQREHHAADGAGDEVRERHEVERRGVEDELDAHEDGDRVAPRGHGEEAEREQRRRHDEEMLEADHGASFRVARGSCGSRGSCVARRAITIAPTSAMSSTSD